MAKYKSGPTGIKVNVVNQSKGQAPKKDTRGIRQKITDRVKTAIRAVPTGVKPGSTKVHTVGDTTDKLRKYKKGQK